MIRNTFRTHGLLAGALLLACVARADPAMAVRIALIPGEGERAPKAGLVDLLTAELTKHKDLSVLEREQISKVLAEQELAAGNPSSAIRVGALLGADVFVFVETLPGSLEPALRLHIVETRSGIMLTSILHCGVSPAGEFTALAREIEAGLAKLRTPQNKRRYVGVLKFGSEELDHDLDQLADALGMLLAVDFDAAPSVIVLDREHLERILHEKQLTDMELDLRSSAVLLDAGVKKMTAAGDLRITLAFKSPDGRALKEVVVNGVRGDVTRTRTALFNEVVKALDVRDAPPSPSDPKIEAKTFYQRAKALCGYRDSLRGNPTLYFNDNRARRSAEAIAAATAAYALDPQQDYLYLFAYLSQGMKGKELFNLFWRREVDRFRKEGKPVPEVNAFQFRPLPSTWVAPEGGISPLSDAEIMLDQDTVRQEFSYYAAVGGPPWSSWAVIESPRPLQWTRTTEEWNRYARDLLKLYLDIKRRESTPDNERRSQSFMLGFCVAHQGIGYLVGPEKSEAMEPTFRWMKDQGDDMLGLAARGFYGIAYGRAESAREALEYFITEMPLSHPSRQAKMDAGLMIFVDLLFRTVRDKEERKQYFRRILSPMLTPKEAGRLAAWLRYNAGRSDWRRILDSEMSRAEALDWYKGALDLVSKDDGESKAVSEPERRVRLQLIEEFSETIALLENRAPARTPAEEWGEYEIQRAAIATPRDMRILGEARRVGDGVLLVWTDEHGAKSPATGTVINCAASLVSLDLRDCRQLGGARLKTGSVKTEQSVSDATAGGSRVYVATPAGLVVFHNGAAKVWDKSAGSPGDCIDSLAILGGQVYLGAHGDRGFALHAFDPERAQFTELASSQSRVRRNELDGRFGCFIASMLADETRDCLWIALNYGKGGEECLWRFDRATGKTVARNLSVKRKDGSSRSIPVSYIIDRLGWHDGWIVHWSKGDDCIQPIHPETGETYRLVGGGSETLYGASEAAYAWPVAWFGDHIIARRQVVFSVASHAGKGPDVYRRNVRSGLDLHIRQEPRTLPLNDRLVWDNGRIDFIVQLSDHEALLANREGQFWKLTRKPH